MEKIGTDIDVNSLPTSNVFIVNTNKQDTPVVSEVNNVEDLKIEYVKEDTKPIPKDPAIKSSGTQSVRLPEPKKPFFKSNREKWIFIAFILPPLAISFISMIHLVVLFETSNTFWMAVSIAVSMELAAMSSLVALVALNKLNKFTIWSIFITIAIIQIFGNMYQTYVNMPPEALTSILNLLALQPSEWSLRFVMFLIGGILPVISLTFVKGIVDYFK